MTRRMLLVALVAGFASVGCSRPLDFTITYVEARGLRAEQPVVYKGIAVGKVTAIDLDPAGQVLVRCRLEPQYRSALHREARYWIDKPGGLLDTSGERQITVTDSSGPRTPLQPGDVLQGAEGWLEQLLGGLKLGHESEGESDDAEKV